MLVRSAICFVMLRTRQFLYAAFFDVFLKDHVNVSVKSVNLSALSALSKDAESKRTSTEPGAVAALPCQPIERSAGAPPLDDGELDANVQAREGLQQHEDEEDQGCYSYTVYELPIAQQVISVFTVAYKLQCARNVF